VQKFTNVAFGFRQLEWDILTSENDGTNSKCYGGSTTSDLGIPKDKSLLYSPTDSFFAKIDASSDIGIREKDSEC
jgi:hypothetical protein